ncbi:unnamed protein product [Scytosiphon promiscuus]
MRVTAVSGAALRSLAVLGARHGRGKTTLAFLSAGVQGRGNCPDNIFNIPGGGERSGCRCGATEKNGRFGRARRNVDPNMILKYEVRTKNASSTPEALNEASAGVCAEVIPVPILSDNYAYLLIDPVTKLAACVDPAEPEKVGVIAAAKARGVEISTLLCTHKHWDHSGGNEAMKKMIPGLEVVSSAYEDDVPAMTVALKDLEEYTLGSLTVKALHTPCHTRGHVLFYVTSSAAAASAGQEGRDEEAAPLVFSGDTLFVGGCGRFFEGDAAQMSHALQGVAAKLPAATRVFCGHEYTVSNLQFALSVEPDNKAVSDKLDWSRRVLAKGAYTVPSTIAQELEHNPFMRVDEQAVRAATGSGDAVGAMKQLREMKNTFRPPPETPGRFPAL